MPKDDYVHLIEQFCLSQEIDDVASLLHEGLLDYDDIPMRLEFLEATGQCRALADLGEIPEVHKDQMMSFMLEQNFDATDDGLPVLSLNPDTHRATVSIHLNPADTLSAGGLTQAIDDRVLPWVSWWNQVIEEVSGESGTSSASPELFGASHLVV